MEPNYKELLERLMHELRELNHKVKSSSEYLSQAANSAKIDLLSIKSHSETIFESAYLVSLWLDMTDFELNPAFFPSQERKFRSLVGKFNKAARAFKRIAKEKRISIDIKSDSNVPQINALPVIDILPYLVFDNAVKYSPRDDKIETVITAGEFGWNIIVSSVGPSVLQDEIEKIFENGYRGQNARAYVSQGGGKGLAIAKFICDLHNGKIFAESKGGEFLMAGIPHRNFNIEISIPKPSISSI